MKTVNSNSAPPRSLPLSKGGAGGGAPGADEPPTSNVQLPTSNQRSEQRTSNEIFGRSTLDIGSSAVPSDDQVHHELADDAVPRAPAPSFRGGECVEFPPLTGVYVEPFSLGKCLRMTKFFGPAAVVASLSLGVGETIMVTALGAWAEYRLLWLLLTSVIIKAVFVTYLIGRYTAITGEKIGHRLLRVPGPRGWLLVLLLSAEFCSVSVSFTALAKPCGNLFTLLTIDHCPGHLTFGTWENLWTTVVLGSALSLSLVSSYKSLEKQQIIICGIIVAGTILAVTMTRPDFGRLLVGAVSFGAFPSVPEWGPPPAREHYVLNLVTIMGFVGGSSCGYIAYSSWVGLSGWGINSHPQIDRLRRRAISEGAVHYLPNDPQQIERLRALLKPVHWDVGMGAAVLFIVTAAFMASGASILYPRQITIGGNAWELLTQQAVIWREVNEYLVPVYYVAIVAALWGTLASVPEAITRMTHDFVSALCPAMENVSFSRMQCLLALWFFATSVAIAWSGASFGLVTAIAALIANGIGLTLVFVCTLYANLTLPAPYRPRWYVAAGGIASALVLLLCAFGGVWDFVSMVAG